MLRPAAAAALAVIAAGAAAAQDAARWGPVAEGLGSGSGICLDGENIVCAVVLCEEGGALTLGVLGTGHGAGAGDAGQGDAAGAGAGQGDTPSGGASPAGEAPAFVGQVEVDGQAVERDMRGRVVMGDFLHIRTPVEPGEPLWQRLRAGSSLKLTSSPDGAPLDYTLRGSAAELDRVAAACR